jgi:hypothetical protein
LPEKGCSENSIAPDSADVLRRWSKKERLT